MRNGCVNTHVGRVVVSEIRQVSLDVIDVNPHRDLKTYPWIERKVEQLKASISDVGFWAGVIARQNGKRYQIAFGHHRVEAATRLKLKTIPLIVQSLTDQQMLQFMGRENGEDYSAEFLVMLNTWEGAVKFVANSRGYTKPERVRPSGGEPLEIALLLGWTAVHTDGGPTMTHVAKACSAAHAMVRGGHMNRSAFDGLSVDAAEKIVVRAQRSMEQMEALATANKAPKRDIDTAKRHIGRAATVTAKDYKEGRIAARDLRSQVDLNTYRYARDSNKASPLFAAFGNALIGQIERMLNNDAAAEKLAEVRKALGEITESEDRQMVQKLDLALEQLGDRAGDWRKKLTHPSKKIVPLTSIQGRA